MSTTKTWPGGSVNSTPTAYSIPAAGELNWAALSSFLNALGDSAQATTFQKFAVRRAVTTPVTVSASTDCIVGTKLTVPAAVAVNLPPGADKQVLFIVDLTKDAGTNNITITPQGADTIMGAATLVLNTNGENVGLAYIAADTDWKIFIRGSISGSPLNNPMTNLGDMIYGGAAGTPTRLPVGSSGQILQSAGAGAPTWTDTISTAKTFSGQITTTKQPIISGNVNTLTNAGYTVTDTDGYDTLLFSTGASDRTLTLPAVATNAGRQLQIEKIDSGAGTVIVDTPGSETINGAAQNHLKSQYAVLVIRCDGSNWYVIKAFDYLGTTSTDVTTPTNAGSSGQYFDTISFTLPEGTWEISGAVKYSRNGATLTSFTVDTGFQTTSGNNSPTSDSRGYIDAGANLLSFSDWTLDAKMIRVTVTNNTTVYYLKGYIQYSSGTPQYQASMRLLRVG